MTGSDTGDQQAPVGTDTAAPLASGAKKTRKPYVWTPPQVPGWADFRAGGARRQEWLRY